MGYSLAIFTILFLIICKNTPEIGNGYYSFFAQSNIFNLVSERFKDKPKTESEKVEFEWNCS